MTERRSGSNAKSIRSSGKSLKEQNRWQLWLVVAFNCAFFYCVAESNAIRAAGLRTAFTDASNLLPIGVALVLTTVLNGLLSADMKARLVFLRWRHALPGHRAFSQYAAADPRIDLTELSKRLGKDFPTNPVDQNRTWYRIYKTVESDPAVVQVHRDFLLVRDCAGLSALFLVFDGLVGIYAIQAASIRLAYSLLLLLQYGVVRQSAANYGIRLVTTVLALATTKSEPPKDPRATRKSIPRKLTKAAAVIAPNDISPEI